MIRRELPSLLDRRWRTPSDLAWALGADWYRTALALERLANDGEIELRRRGRIREFRSRR